jgi:aspartate dehydrogenase
MLKIGVIGCGAIGVQICRAIDTGFINAKLCAIYDRNAQHSENLFKSLNKKPLISSPAELIQKADIVIECASQAVVREYGLFVLDRGKDFMVMSVGELLD